MNMITQKRMGFLFFQTGKPGQIIEDAVNRTFDTTPDTIYGVLVGVLLIMLIFAMYGYHNRVNRNDKMAREMIETFTHTNSVMESMKADMVADNVERKNLHDEVIRKIDGATSQIQRSIEKAKNEVRIDNRTSGKD